MGNRKAPLTANALSDFGTAELHKRQHTTMEQPDPQDITTRRTRVENDQVSWYLRRSYVTQIEADALNRWGTDANLSGGIRSCVSALAPSVNGSRLELTDKQVAAQKRRDHAIKFLDGVSHDFVGLVDAVVCQGQSAGRYLLTRYGTPPDEALRMLRRSATALGVHYGMVRNTH